MSLPFASQHVADLRHDAQLLIDRARVQEVQLEMFVAAAEREERDAEASVSGAAEGRDTARRLLAGAHELHAAARRLLARLDGDRAAREECPYAVLVVDDYSEVRDLLARVLEGAGFVVRTAVNGLEGLIAAYEMRPGVIVMDVSMPVLDGIEATRLLKATKATRDARVIAYTSNPSFDDSSTRTLFAAVLAKPATPGKLVAMVRQVAGL